MCLGGLLEQVRVLLELGGHAHVAELVTQRDHQAADQGRIHLTAVNGSCHKMDMDSIMYE
jgi:hypothetical protein